MVGKIIVNRDAARLACYAAAQLHTALHVLEAAQGLCGLRRRHPNMLCCCDGCQCIELVVQALQRPPDLPGRAALLQHREILWRTAGREVADRGPKAANFAPTAHVQDTVQTFFQAIHHDPAAAVRPGPGHSANQVVKLAFDVSQVVEDVGVVKLQVIQHSGAGPVMHKLAALVKKSGVVLVGLDHKQRFLGCIGAAAGGNAGAQAGRETKIKRHAAHQETRRSAALL